jgi:hypothetical protein
MAQNEEHRNRNLQVAQRRANNQQGKVRLVVRHSVPYLAAGIGSLLTVLGKRAGRKVEV